MKGSCDGCKPEVIFDNRRAKATYKDRDYYRSSSFDVPGGYIAVVELTAHTDIKCNIEFTAIRVPSGEHALAACYDSGGVGKRYRRWFCCQDLGSLESSGGGTTFNTPYNRSVVRWGWDKLKEKIVEFEYIVRPGRYYMIADKRFNQLLEDCERPTILEVTLIPVSSVPDLSLPCECD